MNNVIIETYVVCLEKLNAKIINEETQFILADLITRISTIRSIHDLIRTFADFLEIHTTLRELVEIKHKVTCWKENIETINAWHKIALTALNKIPVTETNNSLIKLLLELLNEPQILLHDQIPSLLNVLRQPDLPDLIHYLISLHDSPIPGRRRKGSFFEQKISSRQQEDCINLLSNLCGQREEDSPLWNKANTLLQTALRIYPELETLKTSPLPIEVVSKKPLEIDKNNSYFNSCIIF